MQTFLAATTNSSGYSSIVNNTFDPSPDQMSFAPRGLKNEASDLGIRFRTNQTASKDKETADIAAMVSRSLVLRRGMNQDTTQFDDRNSTVAPGREPDVNPLLSKCFASNPDGTIYEITERLLLRDVLYVFQGIEGRVIKYDSSAEAYKISPEIDVPLSIKDMIGKLSELGWMFRRVKKFLDARTGDKALGLVGQSFCAAVQKELTEYYRLVAVLEAQENQEDGGIVHSGGGLTLRRLMIWTYDPLLRMKALATLVDVCKGITFFIK